MVNITIGKSHRYMKEGKHMRINDNGMDEIRVKFGILDFICQIGASFQ